MPDRARREALHGELIREASKLFADITTAGELDPLCAFSEACRAELRLVRA